MLSFQVFFKEKFQNFFLESRVFFWLEEIGFNFEVVSGVWGYY